MGTDREFRPDERRNSSIAINIKRTDEVRLSNIWSLGDTPPAPKTGKFVIRTFVIAIFSLINSVFRRNSKSENN